MVVFIHLDDGVESFLESSTVGREADDAENNVAAFSGVLVCADLEYLGCISGVDVVPRY